MDAKLTMVLLLTPAAALAAIGALALWRAWRRTRLWCLCLGSLALAAQVLAAAPFVAYCGASLWLHAISPPGAAVAAPALHLAMPVVLVLAALTLVGWLVTGHDAEAAFTAAVAVHVDADHELTDAEVTAALEEAGNYALAGR